MLYDIAIQLAAVLDDETLTKAINYLGYRYDLVFANRKSNTVYFCNHISDEPLYEAKIYRYDNYGGSIAYIVYYGPESWFAFSEKEDAVQFNRAYKKFVVWE